MIKDLCLAWESNKEVLRTYFETHKQEEYCNNYQTLLAKTFELVINPYFKSIPGWEAEKNIYNIDNIHVIDDGDYQGTYIFLIPRDTYQPFASEYLVTYVGYGSCSGCDTLMGIHDYRTDKLPGKEQTEEYMTLCLHMLQHCKYLYEK